MVDLDPNVVELYLEPYCLCTCKRERVNAGVRIGSTRFTSWRKSDQLKSSHAMRLIAIMLTDGYYSSLSPSSSNVFVLFSLQHRIAKSPSVVLQGWQELESLSISVTGSASMRASMATSQWSAEPLRIEAT